MTARMLVLGGNGLIGRHLRPAAERRGWSLTVAALHSDVDVHACPSDEALSSLVRSDIWDSVVDLRAFNATDTKIVTQAMKPRSTYLLVSSIYAYCHPRHYHERDLRALREGALLTPTGTYGTGKVEAEVEALGASLDTVFVVRLPYVFGAGDRTQRSQDFVSAASSGSTPLNTNLEVGLVSAAIVAEMLTLLSEGGTADHEILNVDGGRNWTLGAHLAAARQVRMSAAFSGQVGDNIPFNPGRHYCLDSSRVHQLLGLSIANDLERQWSDVGELA